MFAIIETGGKQYKVSEGDIIFVEKLGVDDGAEVIFDRVIAVSKNDNEFITGKPYVEGVTVKASSVKTDKGKKIYVLRYKSKKNEKKKTGHRQPYTKVQINQIIA